MHLVLMSVVALDSKLDVLKFVNVMTFEEETLDNSKMFGMISCVNLVEYGSTSLTS